MNIKNAQNILEVGCGRGILIPQTFELKSWDCKYLATDLSEKMSELTEKTL